MVFITHYPLDRYSLAAKFMAWKGGPDYSNPFFPSIYIVIDNVSHLVLMVVCLMWMGVV